MYQVKVSPINTAIDHNKLNDLLEVLPILRKHSLHGRIHDEVHSLRQMVKTRYALLEVSRNYKGKVISRNCTIDCTKSHSKQLKQLMIGIRQEIRIIRESNRPIIDRVTLTRGVRANKMAEVYVDSGSFRRAFIEKIMNDLRVSKKPKTDDFYIGVEIELASSQDRDDIMRAFAEANLHKYVCVKDDGSIGTDDDYPFPHEVCVLVKESEFNNIITRVCDVLNSCDVRVDRSTGLHVHLDMRNFNYSHAFSNLVSMQSFLYAMLPASRRSGNYSIPVKGKQWRILESRYHGVNTQAYKKYRTLELRMHSGTVNATKIINWVRLLLAIINAPEIVRAPTTMKGFRKVVNISDELAEYIENRIKKFTKQHESIVAKDGLPKLSIDATGPIQDDFEDSEEAA